VAGYSAVAGYRALNNLALDVWQKQTTVVDSTFQGSKCVVEVTNYTPFQQSLCMVFIL